MNQNFILKAMLSYCCFTGAVANAQTAIEPQYYQKIITKDSAPIVKFGGIGQDSDGNYVYVSTNGNPDRGTYKAIITKTSENGTQLWKKEFSEEFYTSASKVFVDSSNNIFVSGETVRDGVNREAYLRKYDAAGNILWTKFVSGEFLAVRGTNIVEDAQKNIISAVLMNETSTNDRYYLVNKYSQSGTLEWSTKVPVPSGSGYVNSAMQNNGTFILLESKTYTIVDASGSISQQVTLPSTTSYIAAEFQPDNFVVFQRISSGATAGIYITKKNSQGTNVWDTKIPMNDSQFTGAVSINKNGNVFATIKQESPGKGPRVIKLNSNGEILHNAIHDTEAIVGNTDINTAFFYGIYADENENVILSGLGNFKLVTISFAPDFQIKTTKLYNEFEVNQNYIYGRDGYYFLKNKLLFGGNQRNLNEAGYDLVVTKIDMDSNIEWTNIEKKQANSKITVNSTDIDNTGNTYFAVNSGGKFKVIKQNKDGSVAWEKLFYDNVAGTATGIKALPNGTIAVVGQLSDPTYLYRNLLVNINPDGTQNWETLYIHPNTKGSESTRIVADAQNNVYINTLTTVGSENKFRPLIYKVNPQGQVVWTYFNPNNASNGSQLSDFIITKDNDVITVGAELNANNVTDFYAEKINTNGALVWKYVADYMGTGAPNFFKRVYNDNENNTYFVGLANNRGSITKLNSSGQLVWQNVSTDTGAYNDIYGNPEKSTNVFITGAATISGTSRSQVRSISSDGTQQWLYEIAVAGQNNFGQFITGDSDYLFLSSYTTETNRNQFVKFNILNYNGQEQYNFARKVAKENLNGLTLSDFTQNNDYINLSFRTSLLGPSYATNENNEVNFANNMLFSKDFATMNVTDVRGNKISYYPNPVKDVLNIQSTSKIYDLSIYNFAGQKVLGKVNIQDGKVNIAHLLSGTYIVKAILSDGKTETFKIIKN